MLKKEVAAIAITGFALPAVLGTAHHAMAQDAMKPYPKMAPIDQYLMTDQGAEIALARSAAPESISRDADVMVSKRRSKAKTVSCVLWNVRGLPQRQELYTRAEQNWEEVQQTVRQGRLHRKITDTNVF